MSRHNLVDLAMVEELKKIAGENHVIYNDAEKLESYSHDEVADKHYAGMPEVVVKPASTEEISAIMKLANRKLVPVTPRGAGSGLSGGAVPVSGGVVLSLERMNRILEIDRDNLIAILEPGVISNDFNNEVQKEGLFLPVTR